MARAHVHQDPGSEHHGVARPGAVGGPQVRVASGGERLPILLDKQAPGSSTKIVPLMITEAKTRITATTKGSFA
jgi:hypothetical protein